MTIGIHIFYHERVEIMAGLQLDHGLPRKCTAPITNENLDCRPASIRRNDVDIPIVVTVAQINGRLVTWNNGANNQWRRDNRRKPASSITAQDMNEFTFFVP